MLLGYLRNLCVKIGKESWLCEGKCVFLRTEFVKRLKKEENYENNEINKRRGFEESASFYR